MQRINKRCPQCAAIRFSVIARMPERWEVDGYGDFARCLQEGAETPHMPGDDALWTCMACGYEDVGRKFNVRTPDKRPTTQTFGSMYFNGQPEKVGSHFAGQQLDVGDTVQGKEITWVVVNGKYIADRCICMDISWNQLNEMGLALGREIVVDGKRYICRLLKVGDDAGKPNEWDDALSVASDDDDVWHWTDAFFWGQETCIGAESNRAIRGYFAAGYWNSGDAMYQLVGVGFRPVLIPLDADASSRSISPKETDVSAEESVCVCGVATKKFGSLYFDGRSVAVGGHYVGRRIIIGNTVPGKEITWIHVGNVYIADRCLCTDISWEQLNEAGFVSGKMLTIDGQRYLCRLLKVGSRPS